MDHFLYLLKRFRFPQMQHFDQFLDYPKKQQRHQLEFYRLAQDKQDHQQLDQCLIFSHTRHIE